MTIQDFAEEVGRVARQTGGDPRQVGRMIDALVAAERPKVALAALSGADKGTGINREGKCG
jgi:siroheme synthase